MPDVQQQPPQNEPPNVCTVCGFSRDEMLTNNLSRWSGHGVDYFPVLMPCELVHEACPCSGCNHLRTLGETLSQLHTPEWEGWNDYEPDHLRLVSLNWTAERVAERRTYATSVITWGEVTSFVTLNAAAATTAAATTNIPPAGPGDAMPRTEEQPPIVPSRLIPVQSSAAVPAPRRGAASALGEPCPRCRQQVARCLVCTRFRRHNRRGGAGGGTHPCVRDVPRMATGTSLTARRAREQSDSMSLRLDFACDCLVCSCGTVVNRHFSYAAALMPNEVRGGTEFCTNCGAHGSWSRCRAGLCGCRPCPVCREVRTFCNTCEQSCRRCCRDRQTCVDCLQCGTRHGAAAYVTCRVCGGCSGACGGCRSTRVDLEPLWLSRSRPHFWASGVGQFKVNPLKRFTSLEVEISSMPRWRSNGMGLSATPTSDDIRARWSPVKKVMVEWKGAIVSDGSVPGGFEVNTAPANGDKFIEQLNALREALVAINAEAHDNAGLHCHVDVRDFKWWDIRKLCILYERIEGGLFNIVAPSRRRSSFCVPCGGDLLDAATNLQGLIEHVRKDGKPLKKEMDKALKTSLLQSIYGTAGGHDVVALRREKYSPTRYRALNLHSWLHRGSVEFRIHHGTAQVEKMANWGMLCTAIVQTAFDRPENELRTWPRNTEGLVKLAPTAPVAEWVVARERFFAGKKLEAIRRKEWRNAMLQGERDSATGSSAITVQPPPTRREMRPTPRL